MCQLCALAARYPRVRQDSLVFDLSQFAIAVEVKPLPEQPLSEQPLSEQPQERSLKDAQEKPS